MKLLLCSLLLNFYSEPDTIINQKVHHKIDSLRKEYNIPATAYAVVKSDSVIIQKTLGYRNNRTREKVTLNDKFHIGSLGKAVTSFIVGKLVELDLISWETKFLDIFPEIKENSHPGYRNITLKDLLSHRARLIPFKGGKQWKIIEDFEKSINRNVPEKDIMVKFAAYLLALEPAFREKNQLICYSNVGYQLAGLMLERVCEKPWEQLMDELNRDLNIKFHVGWPESYGSNQPAGHMIPKEQGFKGSEHIPIPDHIQEFLSPHLFYTKFAGHISISMPDYIKFIQLHMLGLKGVNNYLKAETYDIILSGLPEYSMGWSNDFYKSKHLHMHSGGFVSFQAFIKIIEEDDLAIIVFMNSGTGKSSERLHKIRFLLQDYFME